MANYILLCINISKFDVDLKHHNTIREGEITTLTFEDKNLQVIAEDTSEATEFKVPYEWAYDDKEEAEERKKVSGLTLVKDCGIYLMSGRNKSPLKKDSTGSLPVSYAKGYDPRQDCDAGYFVSKVQRAVGGSDFAMKLELEPKWIKELAEKHCQLKVDVVRSYDWGIDILKIMIEI